MKDRTVAARSYSSAEFVTTREGAFYFSQHAQALTADPSPSAQLGMTKCERERVVSAAKTRSATRSRSSSDRTRRADTVDPSAPARGRSSRSSSDCAPTCGSPGRRCATARNSVAHSLDRRLIRGLGNTGPQSARSFRSPALNFQSFSGRAAALRVAPSVRPSRCAGKI